MDLVDCLELERIKLRLDILLDDLCDLFVDRITWLWNFSFDESVEVLHSDRLVDLVPDFEYFIHRGASVRHPWVYFDFMRFFVDIRVRIFSFAIIDKFRLQIPDQWLELGILIVDIWVGSIANSCHFI